MWKLEGGEKEDYDELDFSDATDLGLLKNTQCTGRFVQLLFAAVSLFFLPCCQKESFGIKRYTHDEAGHSHTRGVKDGQATMLEGL